MTTTQEDYSTSIAVIGMAGRFPGAPGVKELWKNIAAGARSIRAFSEEELQAAGVERRVLENPNYVKAGAVLDRIDLFDAAYFGYSAREAEIMDPQHRLFLECASEAIEDAGYASDAYSGAIGVFAGTGPSSYCNYVKSRADVLQSVAPLLISMNNEPDSLASTVSYKLNLRGPSVAVQTFCSTSLVATHLACQSLLTHECRLAAAGGVAIAIPNGVGYVYQEGGIFSPDGHCRTFDATAQGSVMGSGVGVVVLKRMEEALADGDHIYAVIRGSAMNNDGIQRVGYTAPGLKGQMSVIATALSRSGAHPESIAYMECHGTATPLGDAVELAAMIQAFRRGTQKKGYCAIGSVKPNVGHLDRAAGVTGLIKTVLALSHQQLPPQIDFESPNPEVDLENSPFYVNTRLQPWRSEGGPRRAGVSSFGLGGTNAHVVLEEAPEVAASAAAEGRQLLVVSAKTAAALAAAIANLRRHLEEHEELNLADVAYTLQVGRTAFNHRCAVVCWDRGEALAGLEPGGAPKVEQTGRDRAVRVEGEVAEHWGAWLESLGVQVAASEEPGVTLEFTPGMDQAEALGKLWLAGVTVDWRAVWAGQRRYRVPLPSYPFERKRFWIEPDSSQPNDKSVRNHIDSWFYLPSWKRSLSPKHCETSLTNNETSDWLIFAGNSPLERMLFSCLLNKVRNVSIVRTGAGFSRQEATQYTVNPTDDDDYYRLLCALPSIPKTIIHAWSLSPSATFDVIQETGFYSLLSIVKALSRKAVTSDLNLWILTKEAQSVTGLEDLAPERATLTGACRVITQENLNILCRHVDIEVPETGSWRERRLAQSLVAEFISKPHDLSIAWRQNSRWVQSFEPVRLPAPDSTPLRKLGVYLITGGLGAVGMILASHLARTVQARLILTSHSHFPSPDEWDAWLNSHGESNPVSDRIRKLQAMRNMGSEVTVIPVDVGEVDSFRGVVRQIHERYGVLNGVIYAAGVTRGETLLPIQSMERSICEQHFQAKCRGLYTLESCLGEEPLDFCVIFSSLAAVLGGLGFFAYSAANSFADAFVHKHNQRSQYAWTAVNWDTWETSENLHGELGATLREYKMSPQEAIQAFEKVASVPGTAQFVNSTGDLAKRFSQWVIGLSLQDAQCKMPVVHPRPDLPTPFVEAASRTEQTIAEIWEQILGTKVGANDHFFDLGGNSLIATQVTSRLRRAFGINIPLTLLLEAPTVSEAAAEIELALIEELERLDESEAIRQVQSGS